MDGRAGAFYCIWWGGVSDDSDGPLEWCRPVPTDQAEQLAIQVPELALRSEPAHREAFIHLGPWAQIEPVQWQLISQSLYGWIKDHAVLPSELGTRITYLADPTTAANQGPDCDFAVPITRSTRVHAGCGIRAHRRLRTSRSR
jgi:hypothetical protein